MNELFGSLKDFIVFIARDIIYIIGGVSIILSLLYSFDKIDDVFGEEPSVYVVIYIAAIGYIVGWFIQDISALVAGKYMTTSLNYEPGKYVQTLHKRFLAANEAWEGIKDDKFNETKATIKINRQEKGRNIAELERIVGHVLIGTTIGPCWFISSFVLLLKAIINKEVSSSVIGGFAFIVFLVSIGLMILGRIKLVQLEIFTTKLYNSLNGNKQQDTSAEKKQ